MVEARARNRLADVRGREPRRKLGVEWKGAGGYDCSTEVEKLTPTGDSLWTIPVSRCGALTVDADGAVVLGFTFIGTLAVGDRIVFQDGPGVIGAVGIIDAEGHPLAVWKRPGNGPVAVGAPDGALVFLEDAGASEYAGSSRFAGHCETRLVIRARDATLLSDRTVADCTSTGGAWWEHAAVSPGGAITVLGDATASFALGSEAFVPSARDVFVARFAP